LYVVALALSENDLYVAGGTNLEKVSITGTGAVDTAWRPEPNYEVYALALMLALVIPSGASIASRALLVT